MSYNPNDNAKVKDVVSLAQYASAKIDSLMANTVAGGGSLDTTPSTVDGGLWYELDNSAPVIKFYQGGLTYTLASSLDTVSPNLTVTPSSATLYSGTATATVSYAGNGSISVSGGSYNSSTKVLSVSYINPGPSAITDTYTVSLSAAGKYAAETAVFSVTMQPSGSGVEE